VIFKDALRGMRVIEASAFVAAPLGGLTLAQLGAEVIRIDPLQGGLDYLRWPVTHDNASLFWCGLNKSKKSVTIDLATDEGRELAAALITSGGADAGILLTNFPPRGALNYKSLRAHRQDLIHLTVTGDRHGRSAVDYTVNPRIGIPMLTGSGDVDDVCNHVLPAWDLVTGNMAALGILAAERVRRQTGLGQHVTLALEDVALSVMGHLGFLAEAQLGVQRERVGNDLFGAFGRDFATADSQRVMVIGLTKKQWYAICKATGLASQLDILSVRHNVDFNDEGARFRFRREVADLIAPWMARHTLDEIAPLFEKHGVCWGKYQSVRQLVREDPECSIQNPLFSGVDQPGVGLMLTPGTPLRFSDIKPSPAERAPLLGEHTEQVLTELLGLTTSELGLLLERKIIGRYGGRA
jgi:2-methylfumaryl-CoA isomerase